MSNELLNTLHKLAIINYSGAPFLFCYGITWLICGYLWHKFSAKTAVYITLFQGMVALPAALGIMYAIGSFTYRPGDELLNQLSIIIAMSQLLVIPILIVFIIKEQYTLVPFIFSLTGAVHFLLYTWLYQTYFYIAMPIVLSIGIAAIYSFGTRKGDYHPSIAAASQICLLTGVVLILTTVVLVAIH